MAKTDWDELRFGMPLNVWLMIDGRAQKHIRDLYERVDVGHAIIAQQAAELARVRVALEPFARAAEDCGVEDDLRIGVVKPADIIWESAAATTITFQHLDNARSVLEMLAASNPQSACAGEEAGQSAGEVQQQRNASSALAPSKALENGPAVLADAHTNPADTDLSSLRKGAEVVGEIVMFAGVGKEVSWRKGKMPPVGTKLCAHPPLTKEEGE